MSRLPPAPKKVFRGKDRPVAFAENGRPIFGYNDNSKPCCFAKHSNGIGRCMSTILYPNGRCKMHGGPVATINPMANPSFRKRLYEGSLPKNLGLILMDAVDDPEAHSLKEELAINTVQISKLLNLVGKKDGADEATWKQVQELLQVCEEKMLSPEVQEIFQVLQTKSAQFRKFVKSLDNLSAKIKEGTNESKVFREINEATEYRRKLIETDLKRVQMQKNMIPAAEALQMFKNIIEIVKQVFYKDVAGLMLLAKKLDQSSLSLALQYRDNSLGAKITPGAFIDPVSEVGDTIRELARDSTLKPKPINELNEYDGEGIVEMAYPIEKIAHIEREKQLSPPTRKEVKLGLKPKPKMTTIYVGENLGMGEKVMKRMQAVKVGLGNEYEDSFLEEIGQKEVEAEFEIEVKIPKNIKFTGITPKL